MESLDFRKEIGITLKEARVKQRLTMRELAERMGVTTTTVSRYESGQGNLSIDVIFRIAKHLGLRPGIRLYKEQRKEQSDRNDPT